jgi:hypothetical protein
MVFLLIKFFVEITYQWITVTHLIIATTPFSSFVVPNPGMEVYMKMKNSRILLKTFTVDDQLGS